MNNGIFIILPIYYQ